MPKDVAQPLTAQLYLSPCGVKSLALTLYTHTHRCGGNPAVYLYKSRLNLASEYVLCPPCFVQLREQHKQGGPKVQNKQTGKQPAKQRVMEQGRQKGGAGDGDSDSGTSEDEDEDDDQVGIDPTDMRLCCCLRPEQLLRLQLLVPRPSERLAGAVTMAAAAAGLGAASPPAALGPAQAGPSKPLGQPQMELAAVAVPVVHISAGPVTAAGPRRPQQQQPYHQEIGPQPTKPQQQQQQPRRVSPEAAVLRPQQHSDVRAAVPSLGIQRMQQQVSVGAGSAAAALAAAVANGVGGMVAQMQPQPQQGISLSPRQTSPQPVRSAVGQPASHAQELFQRIIGQCNGGAAVATANGWNAGVQAAGIGASGSCPVQGSNAWSAAVLPQHAPHTQNVTWQQLQLLQRSGAFVPAATAAAAVAPLPGMLAHSAAAAVHGGATPLTCSFPLAEPAVPPAVRSTDPASAATPARATAATAATTATASPVQPTPAAAASPATAAATTPARLPLFPCVSAPELASALYNTRIALPGRHAAEVLGLPPPPAPYDPAPKSQGRDWMEYSARCASVDYFGGALQRCAPHVNKAGEVRSRIRAC